MIAYVTARLFVWALLLASLFLITDHPIVAVVGLAIAALAGAVYLCTFESPDEIERQRRR